MSSGKQDAEAKTSDSIFSYKYFSDTYDLNLIVCFNNLPIHICQTVETTLFCLALHPHKAHLGHYHLIAISLKF